MKTNIYKYNNHSFGKSILFKSIIMLAIITFLTSCTAEIDPSATNSISAISAVIGEYLLAILALIFFYAAYMIRIAGTAAVTYGLYYILVSNAATNIVNPIIVLIIGLIAVIALSFYNPPKPYKPSVIISKHAGKIKHEPVKEPNQLKHFLLQILAGIITGVIILIVENIVFK